MNIHRKILLICIWMAAGMTVMAAENNPAVQVSATVGQPFSIKLQDDKNCGMIKPLDQINLLVNGMDTGLHPLGCDPSTEKLAFSIKKGDVSTAAASNAAWQAILGSPWKDLKSDFKRELHFTVTQPADTSEAQTLASGTLKLLIASLGFGLAGLFLVAAMWITLVRLGLESGMLRDAGTGKNLPDRTYSLGRVQMAWWFAIIMGAYIFLWAITKEIPTLSTQALLLMGISGVTGLASAGMDASRQTKLPVSKGKFFDDLLTDVDGVTLHRFQMLAITVILGLMFIIHVVTTLTMPEFDATLLGLMGISGGTYIGFKVPEKQTSDTNPPANVEEHKAGYTPEP